MKSNLILFFSQKKGNTIMFFSDFWSEFMAYEFWLKCEKNPGVLSCFLKKKKMTRNGISIGKIDFLNYSDKTWFSRLNWKKYVFSNKTQKCESKNGCVAVWIRKKSSDDCLVGVKCVQTLGVGGEVRWQ